jgi:hypothetical protein
MAELVGLSHRRAGLSETGRLVAVLKRGLSLIRGGGARSSRLRPEEWPDYLLRDIGLDGRIREREDPRGRPTDFLMR